MANIDYNTILNTQQSLKLNQLSLINKAIFIEAVKQNQELKNLQGQIKQANDINKKILQNQLDEKLKKEQQKFYKELSFVCFNVVNEIDNVKNGLAHYFLGQKYFDNIIESTKVAQNNLEDIQDKIFTKDILHKIDNNKEKMKENENDFKSSKLALFQNFQEDYNAIKNDLVLEENFLNKLNSNLYDLKNDKNALKKPPKKPGKITILTILGLIVTSIISFLVIPQINSPFFKIILFIIFCVLLITGIVFTYYYFRYGPNKLIEDWEIKVANIEEKNPINKQKQIIELQIKEREGIIKEIKNKLEKHNIFEFIKDPLISELNVFNKDNEIAEIENSFKKKYNEAFNENSAAEDTSLDLVKSLCAKGQKLAAMKEYKEIKDVGLAEAKEFVDNYCKQMNY